jgi:hypothetical protein
MSPGGDDGIDEESVEDTGLPVTQLQGLELAVDDAFTDQVGRRIQRRILAGDLLQLAWSGPMMAFLELLRVPFEWFTGGSTPQRPEQEP